MKKTVLVTLSTLIALLFIATLASADTINRPKSTIVAFEGEQYTISINKSQTILPKVQNYNGTVIYEFESSNPSIATVDKNGKVTGKSAGETTISCIATAGSKAFSISYNLVVVVPVTNVSTPDKDIKMHTGQAYKPQIKIEPVDATNQQLEWSSSNTEVAYIDTEGIIHANLVGNSTITGSTTDGTNKKVTIKVTVPRVTLPEKNITIDSPEGVEITYWINSIYGVSWSGAGTTGTAFVAEEITSDGLPSTGPEYHVRLVPLSVGSGKFVVEVNRKQYTIAVKVTREAVYETVDVAKLLKNKSLTGQRFLISGTIKSLKTEGNNCYVAINVDDNIGQYALVVYPADRVPIVFETNYLAKIKGIYDHIGEYTANNGLAYDVPVFMPEDDDALEVKDTTETKYEIVHSITDFLMNDPTIGQQFHIAGTAESLTIEDENCIIAINVEDKKGQYAYVVVPSVQVPSIFDVGYYTMVDGQYDHLDEYIAENGFSYYAPVFISEHFNFK